MREMIGRMDAPGAALARELSVRDLGGEEVA
jgi:hypothetical protein